ncbi:MAG: hypothetical protein V4613_07600 [Bacteroidota bacterium]
MKRRIITEIILLIATLIIALIIYAVSFKQAALFEETLNIQVHDTYFVLLKSLIVWQIWFLIYFTANLMRQFWLKFKNQLCNVMFLFTALVLSGFLYIYISLISEAGVVLNDDGFTVYPPLSAIPQQLETNNSPVPFITNSLWAIEIVLWLIAIVTIVMMYRNRKSIKNNP